MNEILKSVELSAGLEQVLDRIVTRAADLLDAEIVMIFLLGDGDTLVLQSANQENMPMMRIPLTHDGLGSVALTASPLLISPIEPGSPFVEPFVDLQTWDIRNLACIPLRIQDGTAGILVAFNKRDVAFDEMDLQVLSLMDDYISEATEKIRLAEELEKTVEEKTDFVSLVAHELKVPMTSIKGYAKLLGLGTIGQMTDAQKQFLDTITRNVNRMDRLVSVLLDLSRLEGGKIDPDLQLVAVKSAVIDAVKNIEEIAQSKDLILNTDLSPELPLVYADPTRLSQILDELLCNAVLYTQEKGAVNIHVRFPASDLLLEAGEREKFVEIEISDGGIGIAEEDRPKVFHQFFRGDHPLVQEAPGTGFSLMVVRGLIELQKGRIGFSSQLGQGSRFFFVIPVASAEKST